MHDWQCVNRIGPSHAAVVSVVKSNSLYTCSQLNKKKVDILPSLHSCLIDRFRSIMAALT